MGELSKSEKVRYGRHLIMDELGVAGQLKLKQGKVLVVGAGGLGCPILMYLCAAGVGTIGIADSDVVEESNLQRQVLYGTNDMGKRKSEVAAERLAGQNPHILISSYAERITSRNAISIVSEYDLVVDGTDNFATRYLLNDTCLLLDKPLVYGSVLRFEGHVAVFNLKSGVGAHSSNYRDLYPIPPSPETVPNCEQAGVLGVLPGLVGSLQALEVIKILAHIGIPLADQLLIVDGETLDFRKIRIPNRGTRDSVKSLIDYEIFCKSDSNSHTLASNNQPHPMKEITVEELKKLMDDGADFQLIDVREPHEYDICNLNGELIPLSQVPHNVDKFDRDRMVVVHCRSGKRSGDSILWLEQNHKFTNLYNLKGGILAWARDIDNDMPTY